MCISKAVLLMLFSLLLGDAFLTNTIKQHRTSASIARKQTIKLNLKKKIQSTPTLTELDSPESESKDLFSIASLVGGTTVGAGILALPTYAGESGFIPSTSGLLASWVFMLVTGLLVAEVCTNLQKDSTKESGESIGLLYMMQTTLGKTASPITGGIYVFLHYALLIAYIAEAGEILAGALHFPSDTTGMVVFTALLGGMIATLEEPVVESINNVFVGVVLASFLSLVVAGVPSIQGSGLTYTCVERLRESVPVFLLALVYHNVIPLTCSRLDYKKEDIVKALLIGTGIPLSMFILWDAVVLGVSGSYEKMQSLSSENIELQLIDLFQGTNGGVASTVSKISSKTGDLFSNMSNLIDIKTFIGVFSEFAIITSFIGFVYGLVDFYTDLFPGKSSRDPTLFALTLLPPLGIAIVDPDVFLQALDVAGTFGISVLFGAIPPIMAWKARNEAIKTNKDDYVTFVGGGNIVLAGTLLASLLIVFEKVQSM